MEFWAEICFCDFSCKENRIYGVFESFKAQKWIKNSQKLSIGSYIIFSWIWNFKLKFFLVGPLMKKIGSMWFLNPLKPQNKSISSFCNWQFLAIFDSFLGSKGFKNNIEPIFFIRGFTKTNFSSKFQFLEKMMAAPPRTKLVQRICWCGHVQYVSKVLKIGFVFFGNNFRVIYLFLGTVSSIHTWFFSR